MVTVGHATESSFVCTKLWPRVLLSVMPTSWCAWKAWHETKACYRKSQERLLSLLVNPRRDPGSHWIGCDPCRVATGIEGKRQHGALALAAHLRFETHMQGFMGKALRMHR